MLRTKSYFRAKCAEYLMSVGIDAELFLDGIHRGKYLAWFYDVKNNVYWLTRMFKDANRKTVIISKAFTAMGK